MYRCCILSNIVYSLASAQFSIIQESLPAWLLAGQLGHSPSLHAPLPARFALYTQRASFSQGGGMSLCMSQLSGGEKQRVALARALLYPAPVSERASERASMSLYDTCCVHMANLTGSVRTQTPLPPSLPVRYPPAPVRYAHLAHLTHTEGGVPTCWHAAEQHPNNNPHMFCMVIIVGCC